MENWLLSPLQTALAILVITALMFRSFMVAGILVSTLFITLFAQYGLGGYFTSVGNWSGNLAFHLAGDAEYCHGARCGLRHLHDLQTAGGDGVNRQQLAAGAAQYPGYHRFSGDYRRWWCCGQRLFRCWVPIWPIPGDWVSLSAKLIIDVFTALMILPMLVYWLKPKYVFGDK